MKTFFSSAIISLLALFFAIEAYSQPTKILVLLPNNYGANYYLNRDNFENLGWEVTLAGTKNLINPCPVYAEPLGCPQVTVDILISQVTNIEQYDCIAIMSGSHWAGNPCGDLISSSYAINIIKLAVQKEIPVAAWCTGVRVLAAADVINGINVTGNPNYSSEYRSAGATFLGKNLPPIIEGNIMTCSAGDFYNKQNCNAVLEMLSRKNTKTKLPNKTSKYNSFQNDGGNSIVRTNNDNLLVCGYTFTSETGKSDLLVIKSDTLGNILWEKTYGNDGWDYGNCIIETSDSNIVCVGLTTSYNTQNIDLYIVKIDSTGTLLWEKTFGGNKLDIANTVCEDDEGNLIICGYTESKGLGQDDIYIIKIDKNGNLIWEKTFGSSTSEMGYEVIFTSDKNLIIVGNSGKFVENWGDRNIYVIKLDLDGNKLWEKTYSTIGSEPYHERGESIIELSDGGYLITGSHDITYQDVSNILVLKINSAGTELWRKSFGKGSYYDYGIVSCEVNNNEYLITGVSKSNSTNNDITFYFLDNNGRLSKTKTISNPGNDWITSLTMLNQKAYYTGHKKSNQRNDLDITISEYNFLQLPTSVDKLILSNSSLQLFPNPNSGIFFIKYYQEKAELVQIRIFDMKGSELYSSLEISLSGENIKQLDLSHIQKGIILFQYLIRTIL